MNDIFDLNENEIDILNSITYENISNDMKKTIKKDFNDICNDHIVYIQSLLKYSQNKDTNVKYDLDHIENEVISYSWDNLSKSEYKYMNDLFENFKKGVK
tara:strand:- start:3346 stop:3645 length:300 start_codon:yes stop_codon:yes gene_type:complete